jgi:hypothetical protein
MNEFFYNMSLVQEGPPREEVIWTFPDNRGTYCSDCISVIPESLLTSPRKLNQSGETQNPLSDSAESLRVNWFFRRYEHHHAITASACARVSYVSKPRESTIVDEEHTR